ncbi:MAG: terpene cyclase/mutase family protein [Verrucomicrobiae bacterium]|nr:terpene cyclase/mutase family protein [Verrucomicrobiae bacterium]
MRIFAENLDNALTHQKNKSVLLTALLLFSLLFNVFPQEIFEAEMDSIPPEVDRIYKRGLDFLVRTQTPKGCWQDTYGQQPAVVALAVLTMLAHGEDPNTGPYAANIKRGLDYILSNQNKQTGYIGTSMYNHGFSTLALAEAYGAVNDDRLGPALKKAVDLILVSQSKNPMGAWRYSPESTDADTTVSGAQMVALFAAKNAGIDVPDDAIRKGLRFFELCQNPDGGVGYTGRDPGNGPRTAIAALVLALAKKKNTPNFQLAIRFLQNTMQEQTYYHYYLYYAAQAFFHASQKSWQDWNRINVKTLAAAQTSSGSWDGPFGAAFSTSAALLSIALNYRFLPIYER